MPNLMGFSLTMYVVLFGVEGFIIERLKIKADDNKIPYEVIHSTLIGGFIFQFLTLFVAFILDVTCLAIDVCWLKIPICFMLIFSLIWLVNMAFHLYSLRTYVK